MYQISINLIMEYEIKELLDGNVPESLHLWLISPAVHMARSSSR